MEKTPKMTQIETLRGQPLEELLPRLFAEHRTTEAVADELKISSMSLSRWLEMLGAEVERTRYVEHRTTVRFPEYSEAR
jgi:hypothetical protein